MNPETVSSGSPAPPDPDSTEVSGFLRPTRPGLSGSRFGVVGISAFARLASGLGLRSGSPAQDEEEGGHGFVESLARGFVDTSRSTVRAVQVKARHAVSQNKRRYQEGEFDLDMAYITENIIAMGFPAGDLSSGLFGFIEGFYRNHMDEVINFFETHHQGKYKVYNLCAERLYDASKFQGKVACFPFDDHNCPPIQLITSFCQSAYSWLKEDIQNVVVVHCKAGMGRTGLMICSLLLFLKFFPTAEEAIDYFNQKRCVDGKALVLPSQIRYVKYFRHLLKELNGEDQPGRRCMLRGFRLHQCPYWLRPSITISDHSRVLFSTRNHPKTKNLMPEDFWIKVPKRNIVVFALPGQPGVTELTGDIKIQFHDRQGDFYCWLNTTLSENRMILDGSDLDGFDKRKLPSPGFKLEIVMVDYDATVEMRSKSQSTTKSSEGTGTSAAGTARAGDSEEARHNKGHGNNDDDVFSDSDEEESRTSKSRETPTSGGIVMSSHPSNNVEESSRTITSKTEQLSLRTQVPSDANASNGLSTEETSKPATDHKMEISDIKSMAADVSVFSFGDDEDYESD